VFISGGGYGAYPPPHFFIYYYMPDITEGAQLPEEELNNIATPKSSVDDDFDDTPLERPNDACSLDGECESCQ
jgi:hypothetical protein